jgi:hypothetical protein
MLSIAREHSIDSIDLENRRALVRRITRSSAFAKSERLSTLLAYICDTAVQGKSEDLKEQRIGTAVFGRPPDYDSSIDGIVRTQASRLRSRLDLYFKEEGADEPIQLVIPRGGYVPYFEPRLPSRSPGPAIAPLAQIPPFENLASATPLEETSSHEHPGQTGAKKFWFTITALAFLVSSAAFFLLRQPRASEAHNENTHRLWSEVFAPNQPTLLVFGDSGLVMWHGATDRGLGLTEYMHGDYRSEREPNGTPPALLSPNDLSNRRYTSVVDLEVVHALDRIAVQSRSSLEIRFARDVRPNDLKQGNLVLVGASEANP